MAAISMTCPVCKHQSRVPDREVCLGVRCEKCPDSFMEAERQTDLSALEWDTSARRRKGVGMHPVALAWLIVLIVANAGLALILVPLMAFSIVLGHGLATWSILVLGTLLLLNIVCAIALLFRKAWGFSAYLLVQVITAVLLSFSGRGDALIPVIIGSVVGELLLALILYAVLQVGEPNTWSQLE